MARVPLLRGAVDYEPRFCDQCGKQVIFGPVFVVKVGEAKYRVCSFECEKTLKGKHADSNSDSAHVGHSGSNSGQ